MTIDITNIYNILGLNVIPSEDNYFIKPVYPYLKDIFGELERQRDVDDTKVDEGVYTGAIAALGVSIGVEEAEIVALGVAKITGT